MPTDIYRIVFQGTGGQRVARTFDTFERGGARVDRRMQSLQKRGAAVMNTFRGMNRALLLVGTGFSVRGIINAADEFQTLNNRLALTTNTAAETRTRFSQIFQIAQESRSGVKATAETFEKMNRALANTGATTEEMLTATETVTKAIALSGGTAEGARGALIQFGQGMIEGFRRGAQEINSIAEQAPALLSALAEGLGFGAGGAGFVKFRRAATAGLLSPKLLLDALIKASETVDKRFGRMSLTISQAFTRLDNAWIRYIGLTGQASGATAGFAKLIDGLATNFDAIASGLIGFVGTLGTLKLIKSFGAGGFLGSAAGTAAADASKATATINPVTVRLDAMITLLSQIRTLLGGNAATGLGAAGAAGKRKPKVTLAQAQASRAPPFLALSGRAGGGGARTGGFNFLDPRGGIGTKRVGMLTKAWNGLKNSLGLLLIPFRALFALMQRIPIGVIAIGVGVLVAQFAEWLSLSRKIGPATISNFDEVAIRIEFIKIKIQELKDVFANVFNFIGTEFIRLISKMIGVDATTAAGVQAGVVSGVRDVPAVGGLLAEGANRFGNALRGGFSELFGNQSPIGAAKAIATSIAGNVPDALAEAGGALTDELANESSKAGKNTGAVLGDSILNSLPGATKLSDVRARVEAQRIKDEVARQKAQEVAAAAAAANAKNQGKEPSKAQQNKIARERNELVTMQDKNKALAKEIELRLANDVNAKARVAGLLEEAEITRKLGSAHAELAKQRGAEAEKMARQKMQLDTLIDLKKTEKQLTQDAKSQELTLLGLVNNESQIEIDHKKELLRIEQELAEKRRGAAGDPAILGLANDVAEQQRAAAEQARQTELVGGFREMQGGFSQEGMLGFGAERERILREQAQAQAQIDAAARQPGISEGEILAAQQALDQQTVEKLTEALHTADLASNTFFGGFRAGLSEVIESTSNVAQQFAEITGNMFKGAEDALVEWITKGKTDIRGFIEDILTQLIRLGVRTAIINPLAKTLFGAAGGNQATGQGGGGGFLNTILGAFGFGGGGGSGNGFAQNGGGTAFSPGRQTTSGGGGFGILGTLAKTAFGFITGGPAGAAASLGGSLLSGGLGFGGSPSVNQSLAISPGILDQEFARGGVVNGPTRALVGEAGAEAIIPLQGGAVPVRIQGGAGNGPTFIINQAPGDDFTRSMRQVSARSKDVFGGRR